MLYDVFISHASEDKDDFVRSLAELLREEHIEVWYDEFTLEVGDSLRRSIDRGLLHSKFAIVVLSPHFFAKGWPQRELDGLVQREVHEARRIILPIWHNVTKSEIYNYSPTLADAVALNSSHGIKAVAASLKKKIRPEESPLIVAREILRRRGLTPPVISDEWWLGIIEIKENLVSWPNPCDRWIFPLPNDEVSHGRALGENIASTVLQLDWSSFATDKGYCQLTEPEKLHAFLRQFPGLLDTARAHPAVLAMYAPQLTIPGNDVGLGDVFDELLMSGKGNSHARYSNTKTVGDVPAGCGELIAWRHPTLGNFMPEEIAYDFVAAHDSLFSRRSFDFFECLIWLLSDSSSWLPSQLREILIEGTRKRDNWCRDLLNRSGSDSFGYALLTKSRRAFRLTRNLRENLESAIESAVAELKISANIAQLEERFLSRDFVGGYYDWMDEINLVRRRSQGRSTGVIASTERAI